MLVFNTHNWNAYPNTGDPSKVGSGDGYGLNINVHLPQGSDDDAMKRAWEEKLLPKVETFKPDFVFISAGFDSRIDDTLGNLKITDDCFAYITNLAIDIAHTHCNGRLVSLLEGGYNIDGTASATVTHVAELVKGATGTSFFKTNKETGHACIENGILYLPFRANELQRIAVTDAAGALIKTVPPGHIDNGKFDCNRLGLAAGNYIVTIQRRDGKKQGIRFFVIK